jgi:1-acyl-sn-glycerol-3-phosphate acyltransferase
MSMRNNALYRLWGITGESAALFTVSLRCLWVYPSAWEVQTVFGLSLMLILSLLILHAKDPTTLLMYAAAAGITATLLPFQVAVFLPFAMVMALAGSVRLAAYAPAMGRFLLGSGQIACAGIAVTAGTGLAAAFLSTAWVLPSASWLLLLSGLRFPVKPLHLMRLTILDRCHADGGTEALRTQLNAYLRCRRKRRRLVGALIACVRLFHRCKVEGAKNLPLAPERLVFLCNHCFVAGAFITRLYLPVPFRSWSVSDLMEPEDVEEHIRRFIVEPASWLKPRFHTLAVKLLKHVSLWLFDSIDSIPVYRFRLRKIMQTFRLTSQALQAGDNVLIFPENPDHESLSKPGYRSDRILPFFTGFVTAVHMYQEQTGKEVTYVPCYADSHQLIIGTPFISRMDLPFSEEKERVVALAEEAILALSESHGGPSREPMSVQA